jgi:hypothetical protein
MIVFSIDVGIVHLGISLANVKEDGTLEDVFWVDLINLTTYTDGKCKCPLQHTKTMTDWVEHFIQDHMCYFEQADVILIERQPPTGLVAIEQLIFSKFRLKTNLISPRNVHHHFKITSLDYDGRKHRSVEIARSHIPEHLHGRMDTFDRLHDVADSICILLYWCSEQKKLYKKRERLRQYQEATLEDGMSVFEKLESFRRKK